MLFAARPVMMTALKHPVAAATPARTTPATMASAGVSYPATLRLPAS